MRYYYIVIAVVAVGALGLFLYFYVFVPASRPNENIPAPASAPVVIKSAALLPPAGMREYKSILFRFSLFYPNDLLVTEYGEGSGTTIAFENAADSKSFQIFIVPYKENQISSERFKMDVPSGVMEYPVDIMLSGARATMFYSKNDAMGETREVWFIKNGFLYEVMTFARLDTWLALILATWRFL